MSRYQMCARLVCGFKCMVETGEGEEWEWPDDGVAHVHPEDVYHHDCRMCPFPVCHHH